MKRRTKLSDMSSRSPERLVTLEPSDLAPLPLYRHIKKNLATRLELLLDLLGQFLGGGVAPLRIFFQTLQADRFQVTVGLGVERLLNDRLILAARRGCVLRPLQSCRQRRAGLRGARQRRGAVGAGRSSWRGRGGAESCSRRGRGSWPSTRERTRGTQVGRARRIDRANASVRCWRANHLGVHTACTAPRG